MWDHNTGVSVPNCVGHSIKQARIRRYPDYGYITTILFRTQQFPHIQGLNTYVDFFPAIVENANIVGIFTDLVEYQTPLYTPGYADLDEQFYVPCHPLPPPGVRCIYHKDWYKEGGS